MVVIVLCVDLQLSVQPVPITGFVCSHPAHGEVYSMRLYVIIYN